MPSASMPRVPLVVLGAGVIGLTVAYVAVCDREVAFDITIVARDIPGDWGSQAWASPFAGANWSPMPLGPDERVRKWEQITFDRLWEMIPSGLVKRLPSRIFRETDDSLANPWWKDLVHNFNLLSESDIPAPYKIGVTFDTVSVNPLEYLPWLRLELESRGVTFCRQHLRSVDEVKPFVGKDGILVNATSLGSRSLIGVEDTALYPIRGQSIIVQNETLQEFLSSRPGQFDTSYLHGIFECAHRCYDVRRSYVYYTAPWADSYEYCTSKWNIPSRKLGYIFEHVYRERNIRAVLCSGAVSERSWDKDLVAQCRP